MQHVAQLLRVSRVKAFQVTKPVMSTLVLMSWACFIRAGEPTSTQFTLTCTLHHSGNRYINGQLSDSPMLPDRTWTASFELLGNHGRYYTFPTGGWRKLFGVTTELLTLEKIEKSENGVHETEVETINRLTGEHRSYDIVAYAWNGNGSNDVFSGACEKVAWKQPPAAKF